MDIEQFVARSLGVWRSMRTGHSLAFQQFEDVLSEISIQSLDQNDGLVAELIDSVQFQVSDVKHPFKMEWSAESDWEPDDPNEVAKGSCVLLPIPEDNISGQLIRSMGYAEAQPAISKYTFSSDGCFLLTTNYDQSIAEERIWFVSDNVRCRSSVLRTSAGSGVLQTSFASEVRRLSQ